MIANITIINNGDIIVNGLQTNDPIARSILISLGTNQRADNRYGWWADSVAGGKIGSKLWTLFRGKLDRATLQQCTDYVVSSLQWLIDDGICSTIVVKQSTLDHDKIILLVDIQ